MILESIANEAVFTLKEMKNDWDINFFSKCDMILESIANETIFTQTERTNE